MRRLTGGLVLMLLSLGSVAAEPCSGEQQLNRQLHQLVEEQGRQLIVLMQPGSQPEEPMKTGKSTVPVPEDQQRLEEEEDPGSAVPS